MALSRQEVESRHPLSGQIEAFPKPRLLPSPASTEPKNPTGDEITRMSEHVPNELTRKHPVETPVGTWHIEKFGGDLGDIPIFDIHVNPQKPKQVEHVSNINDYVNDVLEAEEAKKHESTQPETKRKPWSLKRIFSLFPAVLG